MISRLSRHAALRQLVKFCIVGASSAIIDLGSFGWLASHYPAVAWWKWASLTFLMGVTNGFTWNRLWTFKTANQASAKRQYPVFVFTNIIGYCLNLGLTKAFLIALTGQLVHEANPSTHQLLIAKAAAIPIVAVWNFSAAKFFAFRAPKAAPSEPALRA